MNLFSYGTLQYENVQMSTFGRKLNGNPDILLGYRLTMVEITDRHVLATSGETHHPIITFTGDVTDQVPGYVFEVTTDEMEKADSYEVSDYKRVNRQLASGLMAWVYVRKDSP